jgi:hypothetical protein
MRVYLFTLLLMAMALPVTAQPGTPTLVYISWDGSPGWVIERLLGEGKLPNLQRLADEGVYVKRTVGNWPSLTAAGHAAVFTGTYGNVNGITGNGVPLAPFDEHAIGEGTTSGFSADNLLAEPAWIAAARQGRNVAALSVTQTSPFEMFTSDDYVSPQGAPAFGNYSDELFMVDPYGAVNAGAGILSASEEGIELTETDAADWTNLPGEGPYRAFTLGQGADALPGLLLATKEERFGTMVLSRDRDYETATVLEAAPFTNTTEHVSAPVRLTLGEDSGWTRLRLGSVAEDGTDFELWHSALSDLEGNVTDPALAEPLRQAAGSVAGNGVYLPPFPEAPPLPNGYGESAFVVNEWFMDGLVWAIERDMADVYASYSPYPDEWFHNFYGYLVGEVPGANAALEAKAWSYAEAMLGNLDMHLGRVLDALEATGRPWNVVMFTDHGFNAAAKVVYPNRILAEAGLLTLDGEGVPIPGETQALYGLESAGGVHINTMPDLPQNGQRGGVVTAAQYDSVVERVREVLLGARDPETGEPVITKVYRAEAQSENGLGGPHGADLYLELAPGYYWSSDAEDGPIVGASEPFTTGIHGVPTVDNDTIRGYAVLGGDGFTNGVVAESARSTILTPTAMQAVGLEPPADATGTPQQDWLAE